MSKAVNILEVLEKAHQSSASVSKKNKQAIILLRKDSSASVNEDKDCSKFVKYSAKLA